MGQYVKSFNELRTELALWLLRPVLDQVVNAVVTDDNFTDTIGETVEKSVERTFNEYERNRDREVDADDVQGLEDVIEETVKNGISEAFDDIDEHLDLDALADGLVRDKHALSTLFKALQALEAEQSVETGA